MTTIKPLRSNVIIKRMEKDLTTASGIVLKSSEDADQAKVLAIGPEVQDVKIGDIVLVNWNKSSQIKGPLYKIAEEDIVGIFEE